MSLPDRSSSRRWLRVLVRLIGPALLVLLLLRLKDPAGMARAILSASPGLLLAAVLLNLVNIQLKVMRWDAILRTRGIRYPFRRAWGSFLTSLYVGLLTPGRVGDVLRARYLRHDLGVPYAEGVASVVVDRLCDLYVLAAFVAVGVVRFAPVLVGSLSVVTWGVVAATVLGPLLLLIPGLAEALTRRLFARFLPEGGAEGFERFLVAVRAGVGRPLLATIPLTVATFWINYLQGYLIARAMGLPMSFLDAACLLAIASLLGLLPVSVSGVGVRELFFALAFPMIGFTAADGVGFGLLVFFVIYLVIVAVGFVSYQIAPPPSGGEPSNPALDKGNKVEDAMPVLHRVRTKLRETAASMDAFVVRAGRPAMAILFWPICFAITLGSSAFLARHLSWLQIVSTNKVPFRDSIKMVFWTVGALLAVWLVYGFTLLWRRLARGASGGLATLAELNRRLRPVLALPILPALALPGIERDSPKEALFLIAVVAVAVGAGAYAWARERALEPEPVPSRVAPPSPPIVDGALASFHDVPDGAPPRRPLREALSRLSAGFAVAALWAGYGGFFSWLSITNHHALNSRTTDLGYYDNIFYSSIHGKPLGCSFIRAGYHGSAHFDPLLVVLSPLYLLHPNAEMLLVLQSVWLGAGVVPLYLLAFHKLGRRPAAVVIAAMYAICPALHGSNMYEFHSLTLLSPIGLWLLYFLEIGAFKRYVVALIVALSCREDVALLMCFVGAYAIFTRRRRLVRAGWGTILGSLFYFVIVKRFFMTSADIFMSGPNAYSFAYYYEELIPNHNGIGGLVVSLVTNPVFVLHTVFGEPKLVYVVMLFLPLGFLPFVAKPGRVMLLYGLLFCMLATRTAVYSIHFQYSAAIIPAAFALVPEALRQIEDGRVASRLGLDGRRLSTALLCAALAASLLTSWKFGGILENQSFRGGFARVARSLNERERQTYAWIREQAVKIPEAASVGTTNRLGPHVSNRMKAFFYPERTDVDWIFVDEGELKPPEVQKLNKAVQVGTLELVARRDKLAVYKKR